ncbi:weak neurotoxin OH-72-like [Pseudorasbora parva]|uniref:weak neurotoxin OH-72-like n=1 Tax=Pseudorasbora parva TaxID=51549 RepID=UPI00351E5B63
MMDLRVSFVLLFVFLTGGYSLKCYSCSPSDSNCETTCKDGESKCYSSDALDEKRGTGRKGCATKCEPGSFKLNEVTSTLRCCSTDLCNAADGVYKGSFLLLFSPLLFYFLFQ